MTFSQLQAMFQSAWIEMTKKKFMVVFTALCFCGLFAVLSRAVSLSDNFWVSLSLVFAPIFIIGGLLFSLGVWLVKLYQYDVAKTQVGYLQVCKESLQSLVSVSYITLPMLLISIFLWVVLGFFFLMNQIPVVGSMIGVFFSFAPFILFLCSLALVLLNLVLLFVLTPILANTPKFSLDIVSKIILNLKNNTLLYLVSFILALIPIAIILGLLVGSAYMTQLGLSHQLGPTLKALKWFFMMLPFNALLAPMVIFFFNFSAEVFRASIQAQES